MDDFKSYSQSKTEGGKTGQNAATPQDGALNGTLDMAKIISKAMNGKSTAQIMQTIIAEAERGKREGTLTNADLDNFYNALYPVLDGFKRKKLKEVIARLKTI